MTCALHGEHDGSIIPSIRRCLISLRINSSSDGLCFRDRVTIGLQSEDRCWNKSGASIRAAISPQIEVVVVLHQKKVRLFCVNVGSHVQAVDRHTEKVVLKV